MNLIPVIGPYDLKIYGSLKAYNNRPTEFLIKTEETSIQEILIISPSGVNTSCDVNNRQIDGNLSVEFQPDEIGTHEIRIFSDKNQRSVFNSFEMNVFDSSKLKCSFSSDIAIVGKVFKFIVNCKEAGEGTLNVNVEQDRKLKTTIKRLKSETEQTNYSYEISFVPELEKICKIELEFNDSLEETIYGDSLKLPVRAIDYIITPFPLIPFAINEKATFNIKCLRENFKDFKILIKSNNQIIKSQIVSLEENLYEVSFLPKSIDQHFVEIYFDNELINSDRLLKIEVFDISKITVKIPSLITVNELNTFTVDTTGAGEGNLEVIIKDGYDTLKAQLLKREKRKFLIGFYSERNMKHDIHVIFNGNSIKESPFYVLPEVALYKSSDSIVGEIEDELVETLPEYYKIIEGGPLDGIQCGEKMWILFDAQTTAYNDVQFFVIDENKLPIKHTKIQKEDGRWCIEFIPINVGLHQIQRIAQVDNKIKIHLLLKVNVLSYGTQRIVYGYKLYNLEDPVQLVFDAVNFRAQDVIPEIKDPNDKIINEYECKYLTDYLALKFTPQLTGGYLVNFFDRNNYQALAMSPYKIIVHEDLNELIKSHGIYDLTRLTILSSNLPNKYEMSQVNIQVYDPHNSILQNYFFQNKKNDVIIEFISRMEGIHKVYVYLNKILLDDTPFYIHVNGDPHTTDFLSGALTSLTSRKMSFINLLSNKFNSSSSNDMGSYSGSGQSGISSSDSQIFSRGFFQTINGNVGIFTSKVNRPFHFVLKDKNIQGLSVYDSQNDPIPFKLSEDIHHNGSIIIVPKIQGTYRVVGLIEGRDFEAKLFVLNNPSYETLFEMDSYNENENIIEKPFSVKLKEENLEVDAYDPLGERVDVRYCKENFATFIPRTTGYFKLLISDYHGPLLGSPFYVLIHPHKEKETEYIESSGIRDTIRNEETHFIIRNKDLEIDVQIRDYEDNILLLKKKRTSKGYLQIFYTPELIGPHAIHIYKEGVEVEGSPIIIYVSDPTKVKVENLQNESKLNKTFCFDIDASDAGEGFIRVNIKDDKANDILPEITEFEDRKYLVRFLPKTSGVYEFSLTFNKYHIIESPFKVYITENNEKETNIQPISKVEDKDISKVEDKESKKDTNFEDNTSDSIGIQEQIDDIPLSIDYEIINLNKNLNKNLNNTMELNAQSNLNRALTPILDTSEEETTEGEAFGENVKVIKDENSHLLLNVDENENNDLVDSDNKTKTIGKSKYRLKRVGSVEDWVCIDQMDVSPVQSQTDLENNDSKKLNSKKSKKDYEEVDEKFLQNKSKEIVHKVIKNAVKQVKEDIEKEKEEALQQKSKEIVNSSIENAIKKFKAETQDLKKEQQQQQQNSNKQAVSKISEEIETNKSKNEKKRQISKLEPSDYSNGENTINSSSDTNKKNSKEIQKEETKNSKGKKSKSKKGSKQESKIDDPKVEPKEEKKQANHDNITTILKKDSEPSTVKSTKNSNKKNNKKNKIRQEMFVEEEENDSEVEEIIFTNQKVVTNVTKKEEKKIDQDKTVVIDEKCVIISENSDKIIELLESRHEELKDLDSDEELKEILKKQGNNLINKEEKSNTSVDNITQITVIKSGKNKPKKKEVFTKKEHIEPKVKEILSAKELGDEKLVEKLKPEESIQYEYEQLIEHTDVDTCADNDSSESKKLPTRDSTTIETTSKKNTKTEKKERFEKIENLNPSNQIKKTTTDLTTYIDEEEEDKLTEVIENVKDYEDFKYLQRKNSKKTKAILPEIESYQDDLVENLDSSEVLGTFDDLNKANSSSIKFNYHQKSLLNQNNSTDSDTNLKKTIEMDENDRKGADNNYRDLEDLIKDRNKKKSKDSLPNSEEKSNLEQLVENLDEKLQKYGISDLNNKGKIAQSSSGENLIDYYRLQPFDSVEVDEKNSIISSMLKPFDLNNLSYGEQFNLLESTSLNDVLSKASSDQKQIDSQLSQGSDVSIGKNSQLVDKSKSESMDNKKTNDSSYFQPIQTISAEDFFDASNSLNPNRERKKSIDLLKAKFEKQNDSGELQKRTKSEDSRFLIDPESQSKLYGDNKSRKDSPVISGRGSDSSYDEISSKDKTKSNLKPAGSDSFLSKSQYSDLPKESAREYKKTKIRKPHIYPIADQPDDDNEFNVFSSRTKAYEQRSSSETSRKNSSEDEFSVFKRPDRYAENLTNKEMLPNEKGIRSLVDKYEKKTSSSEKESDGEMSRFKSADSERVKKLTPNIVSKFDKDKAKSTIEKLNDPDKTQNDFLLRKTLNKSPSTMHRDSSLISNENPVSKNQKDYSNIDELLEQKAASNQSVKNILKNLIDQYEKKALHDDKLAVDSSDYQSNLKENQEKSKLSEETKKLPKANLKFYDTKDDLKKKQSLFDKKSNENLSEPKILTDKNKVSPTASGKFQEKHSGIKTTTLIDAGSSNKSHPINVDNKLKSEQGSKLSFSNSGNELHKNEDLSSPKKTGIKSLLNKYESNQASSLKSPSSEKIKTEEKSKIPKKISAIRTDSSNSSNEEIGKKNTSDITSPIGKYFKQPSSTDQGIKKLINKYEPSISSGKESGQSSPVIKPESPKSPSKYFHNIYSDTSRLPSYTGIKNKEEKESAKSLLHSPQNQLGISKFDLNETYHADKGVRKLVDKYERKVSSSSDTENLPAKKTILTSKPSRESSFIIDKQNKYLDKTNTPNQILSNQKNLNSSSKTAIPQISEDDFNEFLSENEDESNSTDDYEIIEYFETLDDKPNTVESNKHDLSKTIQINGKSSNKVKDSPIDVKLKVKSNIPLKFSVTKLDGNGVPFKVKEKQNGYYEVTFNDEKVQDFNITIANKIELSEKEMLEFEENLKAQLTINVNGKYDFELVERINQNNVPTKKKSNETNVYIIAFKPSSTGKYTLKAHYLGEEPTTLKGDSKSKALSSLENDQKKNIADKMLSSSRSSLLGSQSKDKEVKSKIPTKSSESSINKPLNKNQAEQQLQEQTQKSQPPQQKQQQNQINKVTKIVQNFSKDNKKLSEENLEKNSSDDSRSYTSSSRTKTTVNDRKNLVNPDPKLNKHESSNKISSHATISKNKTIDETVDNKTNQIDLQNTHFNKNITENKSNNDVNSDGNFKSSTDLKNNSSISSLSKLNDSGLVSSNIISTHIKDDDSSSESSSSLKLKSFEEILEHTKDQLNENLRRLRTSAIEVKLEVEYKKPLTFVVTKTHDGQPVEFQPLTRINDRQIIFFNYNSLVDFTIGVKKANPKKVTLSEKSIPTKTEKKLNAEIDITVMGEYDFQVIRKDTSEPIKIKVLPKQNNTYKILFHPSSVTKYILKADPKVSNLQSSNFLKNTQNLNPSYFETDEFKNKLNDYLVKPFVDQLYSNMTQNDVQVNVSIDKDAQRDSFMDSKSPLRLKLYNPDNLKVINFTESNDMITFIVNIENVRYQDGVFKCSASYSDGDEAQLEQNEINKYSYSIRIFVQRNKKGLLNIYLLYLNRNI